MHNRPKRYAVVGTGGRAMMYIAALATTYRENGKLVAFCDPSPTRMRWYNRRLVEKWNVPPAEMFAPEQFTEMVRQTRPDVVIVTSIDSTHHQYIIDAMELGCDVICEKPMTIDAERAAAVMQAVERTGRDLRITFNFRYAPHVTRVRELLMQGTIGQPLAVDFSWVLDTNHGADYFRRWHARKENSGGLLIHKSSHHFDLVNWWLQSYPQHVFAIGDLKFYGQSNAQARGDGHLAAYPRYTGHPQAANDPFALVLDNNASDPDDALAGLYLNAESDSGYIRDGNVFRKDINIEDTMAIVARYHSGVILNYSLIAYCPWEGFRVAITGTRGRIELLAQQSGALVWGQTDAQRAAEEASGEREELTVYPMFAKPYRVPITKIAGGHGGGDPLLLEQLFGTQPPPDPFHRAASHRDGAAAILMGIAANESMRTGRMIDCDQLLPL